MKRDAATLMILLALMGACNGEFPIRRPSIWGAREEVELELEPHADPGWTIGRGTHLFDVVPAAHGTAHEVEEKELLAYLSGRLVKKDLTDAHLVPTTVGKRAEYFVSLTFSSLPANDETHALNLRTIALSVRHADDAVWTCTVTSKGRNADIVVVAPTLIRHCLTEFPHPSRYPRHRVVPLLTADQV